MVAGGVEHDRAPYVMPKVESAFSRSRRFTTPPSGGVSKPAGNEDARPRHHGGHGRERGRDFGIKRDAQDTHGPGLARKRRWRRQQAATSRVRSFPCASPRRRPSRSRRRPARAPASPMEALAKLARGSPGGRTAGNTSPLDTVRRALLWSAKTCSRQEPRDAGSTWWGWPRRRGSTPHGTAGAGHAACAALTGLHAGRRSRGAQRGLCGAMDVSSWTYRLDPDKVNHGAAPSRSAIRHGGQRRAPGHDRGEPATAQGVAAATRCATMCIGVSGHRAGAREGLTRAAAWPSPSKSSKTRQNFGKPAAGLAARC